MKRILILLIGLIFGLCIYSTEKFDTLNVNAPCSIKIKHPVAKKYESEFFKRKFTWKKPRRNLG